MQKRERIAIQAASDAKARGDLDDKEFQTIVLGMMHNAQAREYHSTVKCATVHRAICIVTGMLSMLAFQEEKRLLDGITEQNDYTGLLQRECVTILECLTK